MATGVRLLSKSATVIKKDGTREPISFKKIHEKLEYIASIKPVLPNVYAVGIEQMANCVATQAHDGITTSELDDLCIAVARDWASEHPDWLKFAGRIAVNNHHRETKHRNLVQLTQNLFALKLVNKKYHDFVIAHGTELQAMINYEKDYMVDYFGFKTLCDIYLRTYKLKCLEREQELYMRVAIAIHIESGSLDKIRETYEILSNKEAVHATPTMTNSAADVEQMLSCFLLGVDDDTPSINTFDSSCALISKRSGGLGGHLHRVRCRGSYIRGTNGYSKGPIPFIKRWEGTVAAFDQGGKRKGSLALYMEASHPQFLEFIELRKTHGDPNQRAPSLFIGAWIPDLLMERAWRNENWSFFDPDKTITTDGRYLAEMFGDEYQARYEELEKSDAAIKVIPAREVLREIAIAQIESGFPYMLYKDAINRRNNQANIGPIHSSNLCTEIVEFSNHEEYACCTLASVCLPKYVREIDGKLSFDHMRLAKVVGILVRNLNKIIDKNYYPVWQTKLSNLRHRPIGIGVQGLADLFHRFGYAYGDKAALELDAQIHETIYYAAMCESCEIAREEYLRYKRSVTPGDFDSSTGEDIHVVEAVIGYKYDKLLEDVVPVKKIYSVDQLPTTIGAYSSYVGSPLSKGKFQYDLWNEERAKLHADKPDIHTEVHYAKPSGRWDFDSLKAKTGKFGVRNSLLVALMPTASTSIIAGNNEGIEPYNTNMYVRNTLVGNFTVMNGALIDELSRMNLLDDKMKLILRKFKGSIKHITQLPEHFRRRFATAYEIDYRYINLHCMYRSPWVDQAMSKNDFIEKPTIANVTRRHMYSWKCGIKTGMYYLRQSPPVEPFDFTISAEKIKEITVNVADEPVQEVCLSCGA
jgi:ribonucleotide reductase alpha subunit